jgi:MORN repeat protein
VTMRFPAYALVALGTASCLVRRALPTMPPPEPVHEVQRSPPKAKEGTEHVETDVLVLPDGGSVRDGQERSYLADGTLEAERHFRKGVPIGVWRSWFPDGKLRSEVDFGDGHGPAPSRYWYPGGALAAEGTTVGGVRDGHWTYWDEEGRPLREGDYSQGQRHGPWTFYEEGTKVAQGRYEAGQRVGNWTLWDRQGSAHVRGAAEDVPRRPVRPAP